MAHQMRRQHVGAAHRRAPQNGFDPAKYLTQTDAGSFFSDLFPTLSTIDVSSTSDTTTSTQPVILTTLTTSSTTSTSTTSTTSTTPTTSSTSTSTVPSTTTTSSSTTVAPTTTTHSTTKASSTSKLSVTSTVSRTVASNTLAAASVTSTVTPATSSGVSTGAVVGGIAAGLVALAALILVVMYFVRRSKKQDAEPAFDQNDFRRSAMILNDPPTHEDTVARGFNPPPTMAERHASHAPTFGTQYGHPGGVYAQQGYAGNQYNTQYNQAGQGYAQDGYAGGQYNQAGAGYAQDAYAGSQYNQPSPGYGANTRSFEPGQVISSHPIHTPQSPMEQYAPPIAAYPVLTRTPSASSSEQPHAAPASNMNRESLPAGDYVDLSRSSVSPFQAAQYVEISRRLNAEVPAGLTSAALERELPPVPPAPESSPFADPASAPPSPGAQYAIDRRAAPDDEYAPRAASRPLSGDSSLGTHDFPAPPPPAMPAVAASRYRIDSMPPVLPEIHLQARGSVSSLSPVLSIRSSGAPAPGGLLSAGVGDAVHSRFPATPSPLASSFGMPSPAAGSSEASFADASPVPRPAPAVAQDPKARKSTYSMYDPEDAYGGI
ncbi:hypothetical protein HYPSUDRAFT_637007 [Hypholoma sublateritium FD-334 SS-4]|uniref:REJ domain-containing protein n=1 Tax=Hypholoma sublateritium (strain FD-334 SS-4) TaxID=945553 RepID=A0A0D2NVB7_HYPSF|nr:hypothetical protein HYPSUDRAFT_637007 [Hypholoma sublateritium FD-334 SS-4]